MKKGFTLIELLGVFTIMTVIMLVSVPIVTGMMKTAEEQKYENFKNNVFLSAEAYINDHMDEYTDMKTIGGYDYVYFSQLIENDYLNSTVYDPKTGLNVDEELDYTVVATVQDNYTYSYTLSTVKLVKDKTKPVITNLTVSDDLVSYTITDNYELQGYAITSSIDIPTVWNDTGSVTTYSNTYTALTAGTYYLHAIDYSGNTAYSSFVIATTAFCTYATGVYWDFAYNGTVQNFIAPCRGTYKFEVYGAQGATAGYTSTISTGSGSACASYSYASGNKNGDYVAANYDLTKSKSLYVFVGGAGTAGYQSTDYCSSTYGTGGYNGGGAGGSGIGGGGGATHISSNSTVTTYTSADVYITAAGGKGAYYIPLGSGGGAGGGSDYINTGLNNSSYATSTTVNTKTGNGSVRITLVSIN